MNTTERLHTWSHLFLFLMLFMITLAVMKFSTPTGLAAGNQTMNSDGIVDMKPFLTAVGLLMTMLLIALLITGTSRLRNSRQEKNPAMPAIEEEHKSLEDINKQLAALREKLRQF